MRALLKRGITNMNEQVDLSAEAIEDIISKMTRAYNKTSPYEHLYDWLKDKDPMLFKQWEAVYEIVKASEEY